MTAKIYAIVNRKGGVSKTTTAVSLAHGLAMKLQEAGKGSVLLLDLDPQGNVAPSLGLATNGRCISDVLLGELSLEDAILSADRSQSDGPSRPNLYVIPATDKLAEAKVEMIAAAAVAGVVRQMTRRKSGDDDVPVSEVLEKRFANATKVFNYIIIDCPPTLDLLQESVYRFAQAAIVPVKVDFLGATGAAQHTQGILDAQAEGIDIKVAMVVPTFVRERQRLARQMLATLRKTYGNKRVSDPIPTSVKVEEAPASGGRTIFEYAPDSAPAKAYWNLVERIYDNE